jgi:hypothetical protein
VLTQQPSSEACSYIPFLFMSELSEQPKGRVKNSIGTLVRFEINTLKQMTVEKLQFSDTSQWKETAKQSFV